ncbi:hypothetical protein ACLBXM_09830 [Xanthobacteraceae bacterium A53D]
MRAVFMGLLGSLFLLLAGAPPARAMDSRDLFHAGSWTAEFNDTFGRRATCRITLGTSTSLIGG